MDIININSQNVLKSSSYVKELPSIEVYDACGAKGN